MSEEWATERDFQKAALEWLERDPRVGFITASDSDRVRNRRYRKGKKGLPDLCGYTTDGRALYIELKTPDGKISEEQQRFIERAQVFHVRAGIARSFEDIEKILAS